MINLQEITPKMVKRAYLGKPGCMCGCRGKYYTTASAEAKSYSNVSTAMVTKVLRTIQANESLVETGDGYFAAQVGGKEYAVYLEE